MYNVHIEVIILHLHVYVYVGSQTIFPCDKDGNSTFVGS